MRISRTWGWAGFSRLELPKVAKTNWLLNAQPRPWVANGQGDWGLGGDIVAAQLAGQYGATKAAQEWRAHIMDCQPLLNNPGSTLPQDLRHDSSRLLTLTS